jgi:hypothetical protein
MTAGELVAALQMAREVGEERQAARRETKVDREPAAGPATIPDENITSLPAARHTK